MSNLVDRLSKERVSVATLQHLYAACADAPNFSRELMSSLDVLDDDQLWRALWLLRQLAEDGRLGDAPLARLSSQADGFRHWAARLILCQLYAVVRCPPESRDAVYAFLRECFSDRRVITRAWALTALQPFRTDSRYRPEITAMLRKARQDPGKAMQARLRQLAARS